VDIHVFLQKRWSVAIIFHSISLDNIKFRETIALDKRLVIFWCFLNAETVTQIISWSGYNFFARNTGKLSIIHPSANK
jgi:hypothetical protein